MIIALLPFLSMHYATALALISSLCLVKTDVSNLEDWGLIPDGVKLKTL